MNVDFSIEQNIMWERRDALTTYADYDRYFYTLRRWLRRVSVTATQEPGVVHIVLEVRWWVRLLGLRRRTERRIMSELRDRRPVCIDYDFETR